MVSWVHRLWHYYIQVSIIFIRPLMLKEKIENHLLVLLE